MRYADSEDFTTVKQQLSYISQLSGSRQLGRWLCPIVLLSSATETLLRGARGTSEVSGRLAGCHCGRDTYRVLCHARVNQEAPGRQARYAKVVATTGEDES